MWWRCPNGLPKHILGQGGEKVGQRLQGWRWLGLWCPAVSGHLSWLAHDFKKKTDIFSLLAQNWRYKGESRERDKAATPVPGLR